MTFKSMLISFILLGLFSFALLSFAYYSQMDNGVDTLRDEPTFNKTFTSLNYTLNQSNTDAQLQLNATNKDDVTMGVGGLLYLSIVGVVRTFTGTITSFFTIFSTIFDAFGIPAIVFTTITTIILISIIFLMWRNVRTGD